MPANHAPSEINLNEIAIERQIDFLIEKTDDPSHTLKPDLEFPREALSEMFHEIFGTKASCNDCANDLLITKTRELSLGDFDANPQAPSEIGNNDANQPDHPDAVNVKMEPSNSIAQESEPSTQENPDQKIITPTTSSSSEPNPAVAPDCEDFGFEYLTRNGGVSSVLDIWTEDAARQLDTSRNDFSLVDHPLLFSLDEEVSPLVSTPADVQDDEEDIFGSFEITENLFGLD